MHRRYARLVALRVFVAFLILIGPALRSTPAQAVGTIGGGGPPSARGGGASGGGGVAVDPNTGDAAYAIPILVPPGTAGMQPNLALTYSSGLRASSWAGVGWTVPVPAVRRTTRNGVPAYTNTFNGIGDTFELDGQPLVYESTTAGIAKYRTSRQSFLDIRHNNATNQWIVTRLDGHRMHFAALLWASSIAPDYEWQLVCEEDAIGTPCVSGSAGNKIEYTYSFDTNTTLLQQVAYGQSPRRYVTFYFESRPDQRVSYAAGFAEALTQRVKFIQVQASPGTGAPLSDVIRRYTLTYSNASGGQSIDSGRSLLREVTLYGMEASGPGLTTKFTYIENTGASAGWEPTLQPWTGAVGSWPLDRHADVNGDGLTDIAGNATFKLSTGSGYTTVHDIPVPVFSNGSTMTFTGAFGDRNGNELVDLSRDGRADLVGNLLDISAGSFNQINKPMWVRSNVASPTSALAWSNVPAVSDAHIFFATKYTSGLSEPGPAGFADLNGDGAPELFARGDIRFTVTGGVCVSGRRSEYLYWNNGAMGFTPSPPNPVSPPAVCASETTFLGDLATQYAASSSGPSLPLLSIVRNNSIGSILPIFKNFVQYADVNGDGLSDLIWGNNATPNGQTYLNIPSPTSDPAKRGVFGPGNEWWPPTTIAPYNAGVGFADLNGDGLVDFFQARNGITRQTWLNTGNAGGGTGSAWVLSSAWTLPVNLQTSTPVYDPALVDVNGDGLLDISYGPVSNGPGPQVLLNRGKVPDLLASVETVYGGKTTITWGTSSSAADATVSAFPNSNSFDVGFLPFVKSVVRAVEVDDAKNHVARTEYAYVRGFFDATAREFLGFEKTTATTGPSNGSGGFTAPASRVETTFSNQNPALAGLTLSTKVSVASPNGSGGWNYFPRETAITTYGVPTSVEARLPIRVLEKRSEEASVSPTVFQRVCTLFAYTVNGNPTQNGSPTRIDSLGLVTNDSCADNTSDTTRSAIIEYATGSALKTAKSRVQQRSGIGGALLRDTKFYYDGLAHGSVGAGLLTKEERLNVITGAPIATTTFGYDTANKGLLVSATNPRENAPGGIGTGQGTSFTVYDAAIPDLVAQAQSKPIIGGVRMYTDVSYTTNSACAVTMHPLAGLPAVITDPNQNETIFCYDVHGRVKDQIVKSGSTEVARTSYIYDDSKVTATTAPSIETRTYLTSSTYRWSVQTMDGLGRTTLVSQSGPGSMTIQQSTTYDALGRVSGVSFPGNGAPESGISFLYDGLGRVMTRFLPLPQGGSGVNAFSTSYTISGTSFRIDSTDQQLGSTRRYLDGFGDLIQVDEMTGATPTPTTYKYDATGSLTEIRDVNGNKMLLAYDDLGRRKQMTDPDAGVWDYTYDPNSNLLTQDGPRATNSDKLQWTYDKNDRPTRLDRLGPGTFKTWQYDLAPTNGVGRFSQETEGSEGFGVLDYDALGRPTYQRAVAAGKQFDFQTTYNNAGDLLTRTYPTSRVVNYSRDPRGFLETITSGPSGTEIYADDISWHHSLQLASWTAGNGIVTTNTYSALTQLPTSFNAGSVENISSYTYNNDYRLAGTAGTTALTLSYDARGRLLSATGPFDAGYATRQLWYGYDAIGNLTCLDSTASNVATCTAGKKFTYPTVNPTTPPPRPHAPTAITGLSNPTYDTAGNMLTGNSRTYTYDAEGHVASVAYGGTSLSVTYAGDGKAWKLTSGSLTRYRMFDDFEWTTANLARTSVFLDGKIIAITEESFTPITYGGCGRVWPQNVPMPAGGDLALTLIYALAGALAFPMTRRIRKYRPRDARSWLSLGTGSVFLVVASVPPMLVPERAEAAAPLNTTFFHSDRLGSSLALSDHTGTASAKRVVHRPFGKLVQNSAGTSAVPERGFTGQRFEPGVGIYDFNVRWYDPELSLFVQPDPLLSLSDPQTFNPYAYARQDPANRTDPSGMCSVPLVNGVCPDIEEIVVRPTEGRLTDESVIAISALDQAALADMGVIPVDHPGGILLGLDLEIANFLVSTPASASGRGVSADSLELARLTSIAEHGYGADYPGSSGSPGAMRKAVGIRLTFPIYKNVGVTIAYNMISKNIQFGIGAVWGLSGESLIRPSIFSAGLQNGDGPEVGLMARGSYGLGYLGVSGQLAYDPFQNSFAYGVNITGPSSGRSGFLGVVFNSNLQAIQAGAPAACGCIHPTGY
jgi:RHS repeat-associated protein